jgi:predicted peroxiredoxin/TusA-related sulfurtransferase
MDTVAPVGVLDLRGKHITTFVVFEVAAALRDVAEGETIEFVTDRFDPIEPDVAAWCEAAGHWLVASEPTAEGWHFVVKKGAPVEQDSSLAMVISEGGLFELLSPLGFALGAALEGLAVSLYFQGPGVKVLSRGYKPRANGFNRPFSRFIASALAKTGHIPAQEKLRQLHELGSQIYLCGPSMEHYKVKKEDLIFDDSRIVAYLSFVPVMKEADIQFYV